MSQQCFLQKIILPIQYQQYLYIYNVLKLFFDRISGNTGTADLLYTLVDEFEELLKNTNVCLSTPLHVVVLHCLTNCR